MKLLFVGTPRVAADTLRQMLTDPVFSRAEVVAVLTREDAPIGRKRVITPSEVARVAEEFSIPVIKANRVTPDVLALIEGFRVDAAIVVAYGAFIGRTALASLPKGWFNLHYSMLPKYRGAAPVQWALINGETETGVTLFRLDEGMDTGPIAGTAPCVIEPTDNAASLLEKLRLLGASVLSEALPRIESDLMVFSEQKHADATFAPKLTRHDAQINWSSSAKDIENLIRGTNPEPGAFTFFADQTVKILEARAVQTRDELATASGAVQLGTVSKAGKAITVSCGRGVLELKRVQPAGKNPMTGVDWYIGVARGKSDEDTTLRFKNTADE